MIRNPEVVVSESRTYVVLAYEFGPGQVIKPKVVKVPAKQANNGVTALWLYLQRDLQSMVENVVLTKEEFDS